jgi:hypothetical protein
MKMRIGKAITALLFLSAHTALAEPSRDIDAAIVDALQFGKDTQSITTPEWGHVIIALGRGRDPNSERALEIARQNASVLLTGFLDGKSVDAEDRIAVSSTDGDIRTRVESTSTVSINASVSGAQVYRIGAIDQETWYVVMILAEKTAELKERLQDRQLESTIQARGFSPLESTVADARRRALADALRNAVEAFTGVSVAAKSYIRNAEDISSNVASISEGRVRQYEIVEESELNATYSVVILAEIEERPPGASDNIQALLENMGRPSFGISSNSDEVGSLLRDLLSDNGFDLSSSAETARYMLHADSVLTELPVRYGNNEHFSTRTKLNVIVRYRSSPDVLLSISNDEDESVDISRYPEVGRRNSVQFAVEAISEPLISGLKSLMVDEFQHGTKVLVALEDWFGLRDVDAFEACLKSMPSVKTIAQLPIEKDRVARFEIVYMDDPGGFQIDFKKHSFACEGMSRVRVRKDSPGSVVFSM